MKRKTDIEGSVFKPIRNRFFIGCKGMRQRPDFFAQKFKHQSKFKKKM